MTFLDSRDSTELLEVFRGNDENVAAMTLSHFGKMIRRVSCTVAVLLLPIGSMPALADAPQRIISLSPATTEILFALGLGDRVVGVTNFCDHPEEARAKAKIGGMSNPSLEAIVSRKPDIVVLTTDGNPREVDARLRKLGIATYVWTGRTLADLPQGIRKLGAGVGATAAAERLAKEVEAGLARFRAGNQHGGGPATGPKVLFIVWPEPLLVAGPGTAIDDALQLLGLRNIASHAPTSYPRYSIEEVIREAPDILYIGKGSGMDMRSVSEGIVKKLASVPAVRNGKVCYVGDGLYRLSPRVIGGIEELAACAR
jgi:iron complex transport system substrate-binding protein